MEFDVIFEEFTGGRDPAYELDLIELGTTPALHLFYGEDQEEVTPPAQA